MATKPKKQKSAGGRPRKFDEASRPVTLTLPERTLALLESIDQDRAIAVTKATDSATRASRGSSPVVEVVEVDKGKAVIIVGPSKFLQKLPWLRLAEIAPSRFLLVLPTGTLVETLEVAVLDMLASIPQSEMYERDLLVELSRCLTDQRRSKKVSKAELLFIDI